MSTESPQPVPARRRRTSRRAAPVVWVALAAVAMVAGCTADERGGVANVTLPELDTTTTTTPPQTSAPPPQSAPPPLWTVQIGEAGDDSLLALVGQDDTIVAVGSTDADLLISVVETTGEVRSTQTAGSDGEDVASGVALVEVGQDTASERVLACGATTGQLGQASGGSSDLWCGLIGADGLPDGAAVQLGGPDDEEITDVAGTPEDDRVYASGTVGGMLPGAQDPTGRGLGGGDALAVQLSPDGAPVWARQFGTEREDGATAATTTGDGDGVFAGFTDGDLGRSTAGGRDAWLSRFDPAGRQRWITQLGTSGDDTLAAVTAAGEARRGTEQFIAAGTTNGDFDAEAPAGSAPAELTDNDAFVCSVGTDGTLLWTTTLGSDGADRATAIVADGGVVYVAGSTDGELGDLLTETGPGGGSDGFLAALDAASGEILWTARFGSDGDEHITDITTTEDGLLVLSGTTTGQMAETEPGGGVDAFLIAFPLASAGGGAASSV